MVGRRTMKRPWQQTIERRGGCGAARQLRALWEGDRRAAKVRHRPGESPPSGIAGGPAETWTMVERGPHLAYRKSACWKLSA